MSHSVIVFLDEDNEKKSVPCDSVKITEAWVTFLTDYNLIHIPRERIVKIKEKIEGKKK
jgi:hypothetical protein